MSAMRGVKMSKVGLGVTLLISAVTLDGTVIHKSGLITGGTSSGNARRFNDSDVQSGSRFVHC